MAEKYNEHEWVLRIMNERDERIMAILKERDDRYRAEAVAIDKALRVANENNAHWKKAADEAMLRIEEERQQLMPKVIANIYIVVLTIATILSMYFALSE